MDFDPAPLQKREHIWELVPRSIADSSPLNSCRFSGWRFDSPSASGHPPL